MKDIIVLQEKLLLLEKELKTLTEKIGAVERAQQDLQDLKVEMKAFKVFLGRVYPEFKSQFPEILQKIKE